MERCLWTCGSFESAKRLTGFAIVSILAISCSGRPPGPTVHERIPPDQRVAFTSISFSGGALYAGSTAGLLEFRGERFVSLLQWDPKDPVIETLWSSPDGQELWVKNARGFSLARLSNGHWGILKMPFPKSGVYTRGDALEGFHAIGDDRDWWLVGGGHAWRWGGQEGTWTDEPTPPGGRLVCFAPLASVKLLLIRHEILPMLGTDRPDFQSDTIEYLEDGWNVVPQAGIRFLTDYPAKSVVATPGAAYFRTEGGELLRATKQGVEKVRGPGSCDAMTVTTKGELLASFGDAGVCVLREEWVHLFDRPDAAEWKTWGFRSVSIAENQGTIAWAAYVGSAPGSLWVWRDRALRRLWPNP